MPNTCVLIMLDGLGDRAHAKLDYQTPLQAAKTPCLDRLATLGSNGLYHAGKFGQPFPSEDAHFAMFGYTPDEFPGRGPLEALGAEVKIANDDVAMLAQFTNVLETTERELVLKYNRICGTPDEIDALFTAVSHFEQDGISIELHRTGGMFGILTMHGDVSPHITDSNPMVDGRFLSAIHPLETHQEDPAAINTARVLTDYMRWAYAQLMEVDQNKMRVKETLPPINGLTTQRPGQISTIPSFRERYGLRGLSTASGFVYRGLSELLGMNFHKVKDSRDPARDIAERVQFAADNLDEYDFIHIHHKAADRAGHGKNPKAKVKAIEALDAGLSETIDSLLHNEDVLLVIMSDHSTPSCGSLVHSGEPVPIMFVGDGVRRDNVKQFDEINTASGALGCLRGDEMLLMALNYMDRVKLYGTNDSPNRQMFWPGDYSPFTLEG